jgi:hypothetical protein
VTGLGPEPLEQLVAVEPHLPPAREPVARDLAVAHELAQVLDVHLEQLGSLRGREDRRVTLRPTRFVVCRHLRTVALLTQVQAI